MSVILQHLPSYLDFSYLGRGVSLHGCSSKAQPLLLTLDEGYLLTTILPDLQRGIAPLGPPAILQARLQQYVNRELPGVQAGFRKGRGTRDQIANIHWIIKKAKEFQKHIYFCFIDYAKAFDYVDHHKLWKILKEMGIPDHLNLPPEKCVCRSGSNN